MVLQQMDFGLAVTDKGARFEYGRVVQGFQYFQTRAGSPPKAPRAAARSRPFKPPVPGMITARPFL